MSEWQTVQKSGYLSDFTELDKTHQRAVINAIKELEQDPMTPRGDTIKKLKGYDNVYRYRLGDFRLIYAVAPQVRMMRLLAVGPRSSIYDRFNYPGWDAPETAVEFGAQMAEQPEWKKHPEWFQPKKEPEETKESLPRKLTSDLLSRWRIDGQYHERLLTCRYADELINVPASDVPGDILERVLEKLYPATVGELAAQPDQVLFDPEDLARYAEGTLNSFLLKLDAQQETLAQWALSGPTLVKGGPGSGKSTVAMYRLLAIVEHHLAETGTVPTILFTTYTNALINVSQSLLGQLLRDRLGLATGDSLPPQIRVTTLHRTVKWLAHQSGQQVEIAGPQHQLDALRLALSDLQPRQLGEADKLQLADLREDYLLAEFDWVIEGQNCQNEADYLAADRTGRGIPFSQAKRQAVWQVYARYRDLLLGQSRFTWGRLTQFVLYLAQSGALKQQWDYVIVDEAQDLPPVALALAVELCRQPTGVFLTADANQSLYNRGFRWRNVHQDLHVTGRTRILRRNYRSTRQMAVAAAEIMAPITGADPEAIQQEYVHVGPPPVLYGATGSQDQARWIAGQIYKAAQQLRLPVNAATVLVYSSSVGQPLAEALAAQGLPARFMNSREFDLAEPGIKVTTLHAAKGLEFPIVIIAHVEAGRLPRETSATDPEEMAVHEAEQRRLFFVGCTRAMRYLFVTYDQQLPSPFLADLSDEHWRRLVG